MMIFVSGPFLRNYLKLAPGICKGGFEDAEATYIYPKLIL